jgi:hypothetical protein
VLADEALADLRVFADVQVFEELPIYSRYKQIEFLDGLNIADQNRELILAGVRHLDRIDEYFRAQEDNLAGIVRMVSITDWWVDGERGGGTCTDGSTEILTPHIWLGNLGHERMSRFRVFPPRSRAALFVVGAVGPGYDVFDSELNEINAWCPDRVYIARAGLVPQTIRADQASAPLELPTAGPQLGPSSES